MIPLRHSMVSSVGPFGIHGDGPESELTLKALLYVTFSSFVTFPYGVLGQV